MVFMVGGSNGKINSSFWGVYGGAALLTMGNQWIVEKRKSGPNGWRLPWLPSMQDEFLDCSFHENEWQILYSNQVAWFWQGVHVCRGLVGLHIDRLSHLAKTPQSHRIQPETNSKKQSKQHRNENLSPLLDLQVHHFDKAMFVNCDLSFLEPETFDGLKLWIAWCKCKGR